MLYLVKKSNCADDTNLFVSSTSIGSVNNKVNTCMTLLNDWFVANRFNLNLSKTSCMVFPPNQQDNVEIFVDTFKLETVSHHKYLGIMLDNELKWSKHTDLIYSKLVKFTPTFYKLIGKLLP